jgi:hypothetical protein
MVRNALLIMAAMFIFAATAAADEVKLDSKVDTISLFKNGLAVVERTAQIPGPGVYRLDGAIWPVHGTFWIDGDVPVESRVTLRDVQTPPRVKPVIDFQQELIGNQVTIHFTDGTVPPAVGTVVQLARPNAQDAWSRNYQAGQDNNTSSSPFLVLDTKEGRAYVNTGSIQYIECTAGNGNMPPIHERQPVLILTVGPEQKGPSTLHISYLTHGISWAPSYRVRLLNNNILLLQQQAAIKNELEDLADAEFQLISGFPNVECANVDSLLSPNQTWANFFAQLNGGGIGGGQMAGANGAFTNNITQTPEVQAGPPGLPAASDDVDVHYNSIGKHTLDLGDAMSMQVASGQSTYERVVEWTVPDLRDANGQVAPMPDAGPDVPSPSDMAWDAVQFKNPLPFAMTSAPAMIVDNGKFAGQQMSLWVNIGEQTTLRITRALSLGTHAVEEEDAPANRQAVMIGARSYQKVTINGKLIMNNRRTTDVKILIRRQFSGDLVTADENPTLKGRAEGQYSINPRYEMDWTVTLKAGEQKTLKYQYTVLMP